MQLTAWILSKCRKTFGIINCFSCMHESTLNIYNWYIAIEKAFLLAICEIKLLATPELLLFTTSLYGYTDILQKCWM